MSPFRSVAIWTCPCGAKYRAVSEHERPAHARSANALDESAVECPDCGKILKIDGKLLQLSRRLNRDAWLDLPVPR